MINEACENGGTLVDDKKILKQRWQQKVKGKYGVGEQFWEASR